MFQTSRSLLQPISKVWVCLCHYPYILTKVHSRYKRQVEMFTIELEFTLETVVYHVKLCNKASKYQTLSNLHSSVAECQFFWFQPYRSAAGTQTRPFLNHSCLLKHQNMHTFWQRCVMFVFNDTGYREVYDWQLQWFIGHRRYHINIPFLITQSL